MNDNDADNNNLLFKRCTYTYNDDEDNYMQFSFLALFDTTYNNNNLRIYQLGF